VPLAGASERHHGLVRIEGDGSEVRDLLLALTRSEAAELRETLEALLHNFEVPGWHGHVSSADYQTEITVAAGADLP
jgi:hypothetical protein